MMTEQDDLATAIPAPEPGSSPAAEYYYKNGKMDYSIDPSLS
jgi:hypothetical protein